MKKFKKHLALLIYTSSLLAMEKPDLPTNFNDIARQMSSGNAGGAAADAHDENYEYNYCPFCPSKPVIEDDKNLFTHLKNHHNGRCPYPNCNSKVYKGQTLTNYRRHKKIHMGGFECTICSKKLPTPHLFTDHMNEHKGTNKCIICKEQIKSNRSKLDHYYSKHSPKGYRCLLDGCSTKQAYNTREQLKNHLNRKHPNCNAEEIIDKATEDAKSFYQDAISFYDTAAENYDAAEKNYISSDVDTDDSSTEDEVDTTSENTYMRDLSPALKKQILEDMEKDIELENERYMNDISDYEGDDEDDNQFISGHKRPMSPLFHAKMQNDNKKPK